MINTKYNGYFTEGEYTYDGYFTDFIEECYEEYYEECYEDYTDEDINNF